MTRPLLPPRGLFVKTEMIFDLDIPAALLVTWIRLRALAYGQQETPPVSIKQLAELFGMSTPSVYGHMAALRRKGALRWRSSECGTIIVSFDSGDTDITNQGEILNYKKLESPVNINLLNPLKALSSKRHSLTLNESTGGQSENLETGEVGSKNLESHTTKDAASVFCEVTGMMIMPANERRAHDIEAILAMLRKHGRELTVDKLRAAFTAWKSKRRKDNGLSYSSLNTAWIDYAMADELPGGIQSAAQINSDGSLNV